MSALGGGLNRSTQHLRAARSHLKVMGYSAASLCGPTASTRAAQNLNSGILPKGSSAGLVSLLAAASKKAKGMNTTPSGMASSWRAAASPKSDQVF